MNIQPITNTTLTPTQLGKLETAAVEYESFFLTQMLNAMMPSSLSEDPVFGGGFAEEMFRKNMNEEMATGITLAGGIGLANQLYKDMVKMAEQSSPAPLTLMKEV